MNDNSSNIHKAVNLITLTEKEIKKYCLVKIGEANRLLKMKITKENSVYRQK